MDKKTLIESTLMVLLLVMILANDLFFYHIFKHTHTQIFQMIEKYKLKFKSNWKSKKTISFQLGTLIQINDSVRSLIVKEKKRIAKRDYRFFIYFIYLKVKSSFLQYQNKVNFESSSKTIKAHKTKQKKKKGK